MLIDFQKCFTLKLSGTSVINVHHNVWNAWQPFHSYSGQRLVFASPCRRLDSVSVLRVRVWNGLSCVIWDEKRYSLTTPCPEKRCRYMFASNFAKCRPIFKILSLRDLTVNFSYSRNNISHHNSGVATPPCEILMSEKQQQPETCIITINDRPISQRTVAMWFRSGGLFDHYWFTAKWPLFS